MRLGCSGCFVVVAFVMALAAGGWGAVKMLDAPATLPVSATAADSASAQQKLYTALRRGTAAEPVTLTEREVNALISRNLDTDTDLSGLSFRLVNRDTVELLGRVPIGRVVAEIPAARRIPLPGSWQRRLLWVRARGTPRVEEAGPALSTARRYVTLDVDAAWIGRLRLPVTLLRVVLNPETLRLLRWRAPGALQELRVEPGRVIIRVASRDAS
jgi:hypothetical protein